MEIMSAFGSRSRFRMNGYCKMILFAIITSEIFNKYLRLMDFTTSPILCNPVVAETLMHIISITLVTIDRYCFEFRIK